ncbi:hypothetical protein ECP03048163_4824 [Escherichia coli P0304816.3]|nr:hypothetical protein ECP03048163_4824 [Escherichia coli P0304816.3]
MGKRLGAADVENGRCMSSASTATSRAGRLWRTEPRITCKL